MTSKRSPPIPQIPVRDLERAISFYQSRLGFALDWIFYDAEMPMRQKSGEQTTGSELQRLGVSHMKIMLRNCLAVVIGLALGGIVNMAFVVAGPHIIPPPTGVDMSDAKSLTAGVHLLAPRHFLFPFLAHAVGTLVGALATHLAASTRRSVLAYIVGALFLAGGVTAAFIIPAPVWFIVLDLLVAYLPIAFLATCLGRSIRSGIAADAS